MLVGDHLRDNCSFRRCRILCRRESWPSRGTDLPEPVCCLRVNRCNRRSWILPAGPLQQLLLCDRRVPKWLEPCRKAPGSRLRTGLCGVHRACPHTVELTHQRCVVHGTLQLLMCCLLVGRRFCRARQPV